MGKETKNLLDELATPKHLSIPQAKKEMLDALDVLEKVDRQAVELEILFRRAMLDEDDQAVRGKFEEGRLSFAALRRIVSDYRRTHDEMLGVFDQIANWLNGIEEEREAPDPEAHEAIRVKARDAIMAARKADPKVGEKVEAAINEMLPALVLVKSRGFKQKVRTDGFRQVAERAGYDTGRKQKVKKKK